MGCARTNMASEPVPLSILLDAFSSLTQSAQRTALFSPAFHHQRYLCQIAQEAGLTSFARSAVEATAPQAEACARPLTLLMSLLLACVLCPLALWVPKYFRHAYMLLSGVALSQFVWGPGCAYYSLSTSLSDRCMALCFGRVAVHIPYFAMFSRSLSLSAAGIHLLASALVLYSVVVCGRKHRWMPYLVMILSMSFNTFCNVHSMFRGALHRQLDFTWPLVSPAQGTAMMSRHSDGRHDQTHIAGV